MATKWTVSAEHTLSAGADDELYVCMSRAAYRALRQIAGNDLLWTSTYYNIIDNRYAPVTDEQFDEIDSHVSSFLGSEPMSVCDLKSSIEDLTNAIGRMVASMVRGTGCCTPGSGAAEAREEYVGEDVDLANHEFPEGFDDFDTYDQYKCNVASDIVEKIVRDLEWMNANAITGAGVALTATALVIAIVTPVPFDDIAVIVGILLTLSGIDLSNLTAELSSRSDEYVCILMNSKNVQEARDNFMAELEASVTGYTPLIVKALLNFKNVSRLFLNDRQSFSVDSTCNCVCPNWDIHQNYGDVSPEYVDGPPSVLTSGMHQYTASYHEVAHVLNGGVGNYCGPEARLVGLTVPGSTYRYILYHTDGTKFYDSGTPPSLPVDNVRNVQIMASQTGTVETSWEDMV